MTEPPAAPGVVREIERAAPPALVHAGWAEAFPWLVQGTTTRGRAGRAFDLGLFSGGSDPAVVEANLEALRAATGMSRLVHARQLHGDRARVHADGEPGLHLAEPCDAHVTDRPGVLLAVTTADCVPVFLVDPVRPAVAMAHAGWRGVVAGVLEAAVARLVEVAGASPRALRVHLGPAICGACYEVGPEVFAALGEPVPERPTPIDLRAVLARRARALGVPAGGVTVSAHCTRCTDSGLYSHRGGDRGRQVGYLGMRAGSGRTP